MPSHHDVFDPTKPALVLLYGNTTRKHRHLDRDVVLVGRARGCDLGLEAPDISSVHCLVYRGPDGFTLRDCQSRAGTKLNGDPVKDAVLRDGDLVQIGPFCFRVHLPGPAPVNAKPVVAPPDSRLARLERARRKLVQLALRQRKRLRLQQVFQPQARADTGKSDELAKQASALKKRISDFDLRARALEDAERDLSRDREALANERAAFQARVEQFEAERQQAAAAAGARPVTDEQRQELNRWKQELGQQAAQLEEGRRDLVARAARQEETAKAQEQKLREREAELTALEKQLEPRARELQELDVQLQQQRRDVDRLASDCQKRGQDLAERGKQLEELQQQAQAQLRQHQQRQRDLEALDRQVQHRERQLEARLAPAEEQQRDLAAQAKALARQEQELAGKVEDFNRERKEFSMICEQWAQDQEAILTRLAQQKAALAQAEETLRDQRLGLDDLLGSLREARTAAVAQTDSEAERLREENELLRAELAERSARGSSTEEQFQALRHENEDLKHLLTAMERERERAEAAAAEARARPVPAPGAAPAADSAEVEKLRKLLAERDAEIKELNHSLEEKMGRTEMVFVEAQLVEYRRQVEADRKKLLDELEQVRARNAELDEATRELELEMSRERAEMARERQRLERLRDDVRMELERLQREAGMRDRLAPVQSLREEINNKRAPAQDQTPRPGKEDPAQTRLRALRNRINEG